MARRCCVVGNLFPDFPAIQRKMDTCNHSLPFSTEWPESNDFHSNMDRGNSCNGSVPFKKPTNPISQSVIDAIQCVFSGFPTAAPCCPSLGVPTEQVDDGWRVFTCFRPDLEYFSYSLFMIKGLQPLACAVRRHVHLT